MGIDDAWLILTKKSGGKVEEEPAVWGRDRQMQCWQLWVNEDNQFKFVFVWEYANNNQTSQIMWGLILV